MTERVEPLLREIAPNIWWIVNCNPLAVIGNPEAHNHLSQYLIIGTKASLLVDTALPRQWHLVSASLDRLLGNRPLDWSVPTHLEFGHSANVGRLLDRYPRLVVVGDVHNAHVYYPGQEHRFRTYLPGSEIDLGGGYRFSFLKAPLRDLDSTVWGYESSQQVLFTADGFAYTHHAPLFLAEDEPAETHHLEGECDRFSSELPNPPSAEQAGYLNKRALWWTRFVPVERYFDSVEEIMSSRPIRLVAPGHGNVIDNVLEVTDIIRNAHRMVFEESSVEHARAARVAAG